jgi:predicted ATPase
MDFHTHTPKSWDYANHAGTDKDALKKQSAQQWLLSHMAWGLDAVVITDHNSTAFIKELKDGYEALAIAKPVGFRPLIIYPGFELTVSGGLHLLAVFDPDANLDDVGGTITACSYQGTRGNSDGVTSESFKNCIELIRKAGGLAIAAHVDEASGLLWKDAPVNGREIRDLMRIDGISHSEAIDKLIAAGTFAASIKTYSPSFDQDCEAIIKTGLDAIEVRNWTVLPAIIHNHPIFSRIARVTGSDSHMPGHIGRRGFSLVHMTTPNLEGLRMAFADGAPATGDSWSVRQIAGDCVIDFNRWPTQAVESITLSKLKISGKLAHIPLHPRLNVLVGGRGSGKSMVVHSLRLATGRGRDPAFPEFKNDVPVRESPAGDFWRWAQHYSRGGGDGVLLHEKTQIKVLYRTPAQRALISWESRHLEQGARSAPPNVTVGPMESSPDLEGGAYSVDRFPISIYSQKQVLEMSRRPAGLLGIIDVAQRVPELQLAYSQAVNTYSTSRARVRELLGQITGEAQDTARLKDVLLELEKVQSEPVRIYQQRQAEMRVLLPDLSENSDILRIAQSLHDQAFRLSLPDLPATITASEDIDVRSAQDFYLLTQNELSVVADKLSAAALEIKTKLTALNTTLRVSGWWQQCVLSKQAYDELLGSGSRAIDPQRLNKLNEERTQLETKLARHKGVRDEIALTEAKATQQLAVVNATRNRISEARETFAAAHNVKGTLLRMTIVRMSADIDNVESSFREALGLPAIGFASAISAGPEGRDNALLKVYASDVSAEIATETIRARVLSILDSPVSEPGFVDLQNNLRRQFATTPSRREMIESWYPEDRLDLEYRKPESAEWSRISQGSIGQQAAAVLSFLLSFGEEPIVLDQPEDDLDTRMIMSLIVEHVREIKKRRQIIIVTHNPNIVVHGDAELVHAMEDHSGQVHRSEEASGGLQQPKTREFICDVMEGGDVAFRKRYDRMGRKAVGGS